MLTTKLKKKRHLDIVNTRLEQTIARELPDLATNLRCAAEYTELACDAKKIQFRVSKPFPNETELAVFPVPRLLITVKAPTLYAKRVDFNMDPEANHTCDLTKSTVAAVQILVYWLFTGRLPKDVMGPQVDEGAVAKWCGSKVESLDATVREAVGGGIATQTSLLRPWLEAWVLGQDYQVPRFQKLVMVKISKMLSRRSGKGDRTNDDTDLLTMADVEYVQSCVTEPQTPHLGCLKTVMHIALARMVKRGSISMEDFEGFLGDGRMEDSVIRTMEWLLVGHLGCQTGRHRPHKSCVAESDGKTTIR